MKKQVKKPAKKMLKLHINRKLWGTGENGGSLKSEDSGLQCCLGFACRQEGFSAQTVRGHSMPDSLFGGPSNSDSQRYKRVEKKFKASPLLSKLVRFRKSDLFGNSYDPTRFAADAATINDAEYESEVDRETRLTQLFRKYGVKLIFTGKKAA